MEINLLNFFIDTDVHCLNDDCGKHDENIVLTSGTDYPADTHTDLVVVV